MTDSLFERLEANFHFQGYENFAEFYALESEEQSIPKVTFSFKINFDLHVKLLYAGCPNFFLKVHRPIIPNLF